MSSASSRALATITYDRRFPRPRPRAEPVLWSLMCVVRAVRGRKRVQRHSLFDDSFKPPRRSCTRSCSGTMPDAGEGECLRGLGPTR
eukprot:scaffold483_cov107-Isochrysis_galbana.AAC.2